jgi:hypothetical protein
MLSSSDDSHSVISLTGKVRMLRIFLSTELISQNIIPKIPNMIYMSLYIVWILNHNSGM